MLCLNRGKVSYCSLFVAFADSIKIIKSIVKRKRVLGFVAVFKKLQPFIAQKIVKRARASKTMPVRVVIYADNHIIYHVSLLLRHSQSLPLGSPLQNTPIIPQNRPDWSGVDSAKDIC